MSALSCGAQRSQSDPFKLPPRSKRGRRDEDSEILPSGAYHAEYG